jgi:uncharacterized protein (DUF2336 family)
MVKSAAYPPLDGLVDLACRNGVDVRPTLLRVLTDLYVQKPTHSADEEIQYVELALGLIDAVDATTRAAVASSLSTYPAAPAAVLSKLVGVPSPHDSGAPFQAKAETENLVDLFFAADSEERRLILVNLDAASTTSAPLTAPVSNEVIRRLENAALQRHTDEFSRMLERALGISRELAERITRDHSGEPIVVAAKALGMKAAVLQRILLFLNPMVGQSVKRIYDLAQLYDELSREAAQRMMAIWRKAGEPSRPAQEPLYQIDEDRDARSLATPAPSRAARDQQPERFKTTR